MAPDASGAEPHPPGSTIGRYEIVRMLGSGGMGRVYLARDLRLERLVALKCLDPRVAERDTDRGAILREARAAAGLTHPGIAHVHDVIDDQGEIVLVMEYVAGTSLRDRLAAGPCAVEESVRIAATISDALTDAHAAGIVHCDIKPANIQLLSNGSVKILDFGVARRFTLSPQATTLEGQAALGGTPGYMSPEQVFGLPVDQRSDLFSLGIVLFEMLTTRLPFASSANWSDAKRTTRGELATNEAVPEALRQIVYRAIQRDASLRFQNAAEMRDALRTAFPTAAMPAVPPHPHSKKVLLTWAVIVTLLVLLTGGAFQLPRPATDPVLLVMPLASGPGVTDDATGAGVTEMLISELSTVRELAVVRPPPGTVENDPVRAAKNSGASVVLSGSVESLPARGVIIQLDLRTAPQWAVRWTRTYDVPGSGYLGLRRTVAREFLEALIQAGALRTPIAAPAAPAHAASGPAFADYVTGRVNLERRDLPGSIDRAVAAFERAIAQDPDFSLAHAGLAEASWQKYAATDDSTWVVRGQQAAERAVQTDHFSAQAHYALGLLLDATGKSDAAVTELRTAIDLQPLNDDAHRLLGRILARRGQLDEGLAELQKAVAIRPGFWENHREVGLTHFSAGSYDCAIAAFLQVTALQPESPRGFLMLGAAQMAGDDLAAALQAFTRATALQPDADALANIGTIYYWLGQYQKAFENTQRAVRLRPTEPLFHRNLGDVELKLKRAAAARASYGRAKVLTEAQLRVNPADALLQSRLAVYEAKLADTAAASRLIAGAVKQAGGNAEVIYNSAVVQALSNQREAAMRSLAAALQAGISGQVAQRDDDLAALHSQEFDRITRSGPVVARRCS